MQVCHLEREICTKVREVSKELKSFEKLPQGVIIDLPYDEYTDSFMISFPREWKLFVMVPLNTSEISIHLHYNGKFITCPSLGYEENKKIFHSTDEIKEEIIRIYSLVVV